LAKLSFFILRKLTMLWRGELDEGEVEVPEHRSIDIIE
jgi:hypothetical protein